MTLRNCYKMIAALLSLALLLYSLNFLYFYWQEKPEPGQPLPSLSVVPDKTRLLVIAPHCDDETLGCAGMIQDVLAGGGQVLVVIMTNGDGFTFAVEEQVHRLFLTSADYIQSGYARQRETVQAISRLGLAREQIIFLGYPDRGLRAIWSQAWDNSQPYRSRFTESDHSPYNNSYLPNAPYAGEGVLANLEQIMRDFKPTLILGPHPADQHPDHFATWAFATTALIQMRSSDRFFQPDYYTYLVHRGDFPIPHGYKPNETLLPPKTLLKSKDNGWNLYPLNPEREMIKEQALKEYVSQLRVPIMSNLLYSFIRSNELFAQVAIPVVQQEYSGADLSSLDTWQKHEPFLINPPGINPIGALERKASVKSIAGVVQQNTLWLHVSIPDFAKRWFRYQVSLVEYYNRPENLKRETKEFYFSSAETDLSPDQIFRFQDDVIIKIPYSPDMPNYFFIHILTRGEFGVMSNQTVWQPVLIQ